VKHLLIFATALALLAQLPLSHGGQGSASQPKTFPTCGKEGSDCHCARRVAAIQERDMKRCRVDRTAEQCLRDEERYCDIVARDVGLYEGESRDENEGMNAHCTMACKMHDCKCGHNHETCHVDHLAKDHAK